MPNMPPTPAHPHASSTTEQHRKKRQFQPSITSYFHHQEPSDCDYDSDNDDDDQAAPRPRYIPRPAPRHPTLAPQLPDHIQSSLLSVGMRVRKSVPEGYKTAKTALPPLQTSTTLRHPNSALDAMKIPVDTLASTLQHQRELLPFCGLNKIGGYAEQPTTNPHLFGGMANSFPLPAQAFSQPFSSQDSGYGTDWSRANPTNPAKRVWTDDEDKPAPLSTNFFFNIPIKTTGDDDVPVSPLSESPPPSINMPKERQFAQPKSRRRARHDIDMDMDYEPSGLHEGTLAAGHASDFEDADFLDGHEVAMGGV
jgi:hypothetical protein